MATATAFDTHKAVHVLREAGFDQTQAAAITNQIAAAVGNNVATKADLEILNTNLKGEMDRLRTELKGEMEGLRTEFKGEMEGLRIELRGEMEGLRIELKGEMAQHRAEVKGEMAQHWAEVKADLKSMEMRICAMIAAAVGLIKALDFLIG